MNIALQLFGYLILTVLAIVVPIFIVLLSIFQEGVSKLSAQYEIKKKQSEKNLEEQSYICLHQEKYFDKYLLLRNYAL